ncbi:DUF4430 domain-containing protein [Candidatus Kaiserbacteria bacterium]|nr:DUF4430 domain-containing protein [Candidatus Kaiserbacteria bacterium]
MKKYIALAIVVVILAGGAYVSQQWFVQTFDTATEREVQTVTFSADAEGSVLDAMNVLSTEGRLSFSGRDFPGLGFFVEEINGRRSADGYYWILRINGALSDKGVSQARVETGDIIEWRYEMGY